MDFLEATLGVDTSLGAGVAVSAAGELVVTGNTGTANQIDLDRGNVVVNLSGTPTLPFDFTQTQEADGES
ncbi:MAG: hypothetical protein R3318_05740, partial [Gammaproteobacteria bacterium]|nr:hypothetical protein [Gammaproteobacteria bacterium]